MDTIKFVNLINQIDLKLYYTGTEKCKENHSWGPAIKQHFKVHYIHKGKGVFSLNNTSYELSSGQGFLICPNTISYYKADSVEPWEYSWCAFDGINAEAYLKRANLSLNNPVFIYEKDDKLENCLYDMSSALNLEKSKDLKLQSLLYEFLSIIIEAADFDAENHLDKTNKTVYINKTIEFIQINYSRGINVSEIAKFVGLDRKYISKLIKNSLGVTLQQYLMGYRINKANEFMKDKTLSIGDIARSVGYENQLVFSSMYKNTTGVSPSEYRRIHFSL